jgi:hypothetical protein
VAGAGEEVEVKVEVVDRNKHNDVIIILHPIDLPLGNGISHSHSGLLLCNGSPIAQWEILCNGRDQVKQLVYLYSSQRPSQDDQY